jgi:hypothetical protein
MGMKPSLYNAVCFYCWGEEFSKGNFPDHENPFGFDEVILNILGMDLFNCTNLS